MKINLLQTVFKTKISIWKQWAQLVSTQRNFENKSVHFELCRHCNVDDHQVLFLWMYEELNCSYWMTPNINSFFMKITDWKIPVWCNHKQLWMVCRISIEKYPIQLHGMSLIMFWRKLVWDSTDYYVWQCFITLDFALGKSEFNCQVVAAVVTSRPESLSTGIRLLIWLWWCAMNSWHVH